MPINAFSIDSRTFSFESDLDDVVPIGSYVAIEVDDGRLYLGQVLSEEVRERSEAGPGGAAVRTVSGRGRVLGLISEGETVPGDLIAGFGPARMRLAGSSEVAGHLHAAAAAGVALGQVRGVSGVEAVLDAKGFGRHTFLCGQSGSGKTYTLGLILERLLLATDLQLAIIDPNSDYVRLPELRSREQTGLTEGAYQDLVDRYGPLGSRIYVFGGPDSPRRLRARWGRMTLEQQLILLGLDASKHPDAYYAYSRIIGGIEGDDYTLDDVLEAVRSTFAEDARRLGLRIENSGVADLDIWARSGANAIREEIPDDWRALVLDLGSLSSGRERSISAATALGTLWERRHQRQPVLIVIDEAHNVCPQNPSDPIQALATDHAIRIAGEGRKYGLYLLLSTQRPDKVHENVLSQCDNLVLMRMNSSADVRRLEEVFSFVPPSLLEQAPSFGLGEGLAAGKIARDPLLFTTGRRYTEEGGSDIPSDWAKAR